MARYMVDCMDMRSTTSTKGAPRNIYTSHLTAGLLGENYLGIMPGAETEYFVDSDVIELTQSAVILENIISQFLYNFQEKKE